jgi:hypothetical protein
MSQRSKRNRTSAPVMAVIGPERRVRAKLTDYLAIGRVDHWVRNTFVPSGALREIDIPALHILVQSIAVR